MVVGCEGKGPDRGSAYSKEEPIIVKGPFVRHVLANAGIVGGVSWTAQEFLGTVNLPSRHSSIFRLESVSVCNLWFFTYFGMDEIESRWP